MANTGYGLQFSRTLHGGQPLTKRFYVPSTDSTALYEGDVVEIPASSPAMDAAGEFAVVTRATSGHVLVGVIEGFEPDSGNVQTGNYRAASTARYVNVIIDPDACYFVMEDAVGGAALQADIAAMSNYNIIVAAGSTATGLSGTMLDSSTVTEAAADLKVIGIRVDKVNVGAATNGTELEVMILAPAIKATESDN